MASSKKKVILRRVTGEILPGYLPLSGFTRGAGSSRVVELLDLSGRLIEIPLGEVRMISYVRDFNLADTTNPERLTRRSFLARPRNEGVWVRMTFKASERSLERTSEIILEGLAAADLSLLDSLIEDGGLHVAPPDIRSNTQRIFVPRAAIESLQILAVITTPSRAKPVPERTPEEIQKSLFEALTPRNTRPN
ncbi:hypothetical protein HDF16_004222 [Granulicella aggregans]|uniref:Uncharacterized protein n=1 Tax=Granulicella aggregans TaxID=474949 RepID=A0A7W7ZGQ6_9BACT|nr:hypothetical protein [Granulicella aggregans]MBB5059496.1 hypothetical protein [Granulicella aggregans]